jgi:hypothetical protein
MSDKVVTPAAWRGETLQTYPQQWLYQLTGAEVSALVDAARAVVRSGLPLGNIKRGDYPLHGLNAALEDWRTRIDRGHGMVLVRGLPVREIGRDVAAAAYWLIGLQLGEPTAQNAAGETLVDIRDTGASASDHNVRLYKTRAELSFHTDGADIIGLLCLRGARAGGVSRICSSVEVYNQILARRPDLAALLELDYHHHAHGQFGADGPKTFRYPIVSRRDGQFRMLLLLWYIRNAAEDFPEIAALTPAQEELLDLLETIPFEPGVALDMRFQEGDMQFLKNSVVLHARTDYEDWDAPDDKRHLLRLWLNVPEFVDGDDRLRHGFAKQDGA